MAKKARGRHNLSSGLSRLSVIRASHGASVLGPSINIHGPRGGKATTYLMDRSDHIWRTASVPMPSAKFNGDYRAVVSRVPSRLDPSFMMEPRSIQGVPRPEQRKRGLVRKQVPSMLGMLTPNMS